METVAAQQTPFHNTLSVGPLEGDRAFYVYSGGNTIGYVQWDSSRYSAKYLMPRFTPNPSTVVTALGAERYASAIRYTMEVLMYIEAALAPKRAEHQEAMQVLEVERAKRNEQFRIEREAAAAKRQAKISTLHEKVKWHLCEQMRLTRHGYRSTVFGTIDSVFGYGMNITTEKGKFMTIYFHDIETMELRDEDAGRGKYISIYNEKESQ